MSNHCCFVYLELIKQMIFLLNDFSQTDFIFLCFILLLCLLKHGSLYYLFLAFTNLNILTFTVPNFLWTWNKKYLLVVVGLYTFILYSYNYKAITLFCVQIVLLNELYKNKSLQLKYIWRGTFLCLRRFS